MGLLNSQEQMGGLLGQMMFDPSVRQWRRGLLGRYGEEPQIEGGDYNYQRAFQMGVRPQEYPHDPGMMHWPSRAPPVPPRREGELLKAPDHETLWMERFMQTYGVDPNEAPPELIVDALQKGIMPGLLGR
jgi:hypothetical protein